MAKEKVSLPKKRKKKNGRYYELLGIVLFALGVFVAFGIVGNDGGILGSWLTDTFRFFFGVTALVPALLLVLLGVRYVYRGRGFSLSRREGIALVLYVLALVWIHHLLTGEGREMASDAILSGGGLLGGGLTYGLRLFLGGIGTTIFLLCATGAGALLLSHWSLTGGAQKLGAKTEEKARQVQHAVQEKKAEWEERRASRAEAVETPHEFLFRRRKEEEMPEEEPVTEEAPEAEETLPPDFFTEAPETTPQETEETEPEDFPEETEEMPAEEPQEEEPEPEEILEEETEEEEEEPEEEETPEPAPAAETPAPTYRFPPISLLHEGKASSLSANDAKNHMQTLESTLKSFGVNVRITNVAVGPTVTRYELEPAPGVKVSRITSLSDDIALQLAATHIRIEAPIPGKSAVGIEVPNAKTAEVPLRSVLDDPLFKDRKGGVPVALGKDITGKTVVTDLAKMPHLLIAGSTGSGKSVCINTLITSILYHAMPEEVKLILIDPKVVELSVYNGIPHLRIPVVTEAKKAAGALHWAVREMEQRYQQFSLSRVRDIGGYNKIHPENKLPFIIIIIDELADLMMAAPDSVEDAICRLAQKARAAGIHLVLATQRPSVDVITGVIKANIPSRISFAVSSQVDSRTILDMAGAEKLVGKGDMLFNPIGAPNPIRVQGAFISDEEVEEVTTYIKNERKEEPVAYEEIDLTLPNEKGGEKGDEPEEADELLQEAAEWILDTKKASVSMLQRRFRIGYTRAGRLMDTLEHMGIVGPAEGAKPREVLMTREQAVEKYWNGDNG